MNTYTNTMLFISYIIMFWMVTGFIAVKGAEYYIKQHGKKEDDELKMLNELFLEQYYDNNFAGKVIFILSNGAVFWAFIFTYWYWSKRNKNK